MNGSHPVIPILFSIVVIFAYGSSAHARRFHEHKKDISVQEQLLNEILGELREIRKSYADNNDDNDVEDDQTDSVHQWLEQNDKKLGIRTNKVAMKNWAYVTNLTDENANILSHAHVTQDEWFGARVKEAKQFLENKDQIDNSDMIRQLELWAYGSTEPVAKDKATITTSSRLHTELTSIYGNAQVTKGGKIYRIEPEFTEIMSSSHDYDELKWAWQAWRDATGPQMRSKFTELVTNMNQAAKDNGMDDVGVAWRRGNYGKDNIKPMVDDLYDDIKPLYEQLQAFVRHKLVAYYSDENLDPNSPIPAHILGNMWAQDWKNIRDIVVPFPEVETYDVTDTMVAQGYTPLKLFQLAEEFFTSIGLEPMTDKFWDLSMIVRPDDRPVQCHASAEDFLTDDDFRIKMCTVVNMEDLQTIHHEMGHIEYFMQYRHQPTIYRDGANAAFHEAIGDTIALSVMTPDHLSTVGLLDYESKSTTRKNQDKNCFTSDVTCTKQEKRDLNQLMSMALEKVAFLPFGYLIDKWRWDVFSGQIKPSEYNTKWWEYRLKYQGVEAPVPRTEQDFDPGSKYHVPASVPYVRYFLSFIGQFQFQKALCDASGYSGPLHHCDIYRSTDAGELLKSVLSKGSSSPWEDVMESFTGQRNFSTDAIYAYFAPLYEWLKKYNEENNVPIGWGQ